MKHTWLKLLTSILWSEKFRKLPNNDYRMVYFGLLILSKLHLEKEPNAWVAPTLFVSARKLRTVKKRLFEVGLLEGDGIVIGFEDSQLTPEALRKRLQRSRDKERDMSRDKSRDKSCDSHGTSHGDSRKQSIEKKERGDSGNGIPRGKACAKPNPPPGDFQNNREPGTDSRPGPQPLAKPGQVGMLEEMAEERGVSLDTAAAGAGVLLPVRSADVTALRRALEGRPRLKPGDTARAAQNALIGDLKMQLTTMFEFEGSVAARRWIDNRDFDTAVHRALIAHWQTLKQTPELDQSTEAAL